MTLIDYIKNALNEQPTIRHEFIVEVYTADVRSHEFRLDDDKPLQSKGIFSSFRNSGILRNECDYVEVKTTRNGAQVSYQSYYEHRLLIN